MILQIDTRKFFGRGGIDPHEPAFGYVTGSITRQNAIHRGVGGKGNDADAKRRKNLPENMCLKKYA